MYEQRWASDPHNPLKLYDCLKPQMQDKVLKPIQALPETHMHDFRLMIDLKHAEARVKET